MQRKLYAVAMLFSVVLLVTGCASTAVVKQATVGEIVHDEALPIERAYRAPSGGLVLYTRAALAGSREILPCTLYVSAQQLELPAQPCGFRGQLIELPRSVIARGWPDEVAVRNLHLTGVPVCEAALGTAIDGDVESLRNLLQPSDGATETVYNVRGYGTGGRWEFVYVRGEHHAAFTVKPATVHPDWCKIFYLPWAALLDGACCLGAFYGGGFPEPDTWENLGSDETTAIRRCSR